MVELKSVVLPSKLGQALSDSGSSLPKTFKNIQSSGGKRIEPPAAAVVDEDFKKLENFSNKQPNLLFVCDYVVEDKSIGSLIVFEQHLDATHYEVFKKNKFDNEPKFERIKLLDLI